MKVEERPCTSPVHQRTPLAHSAERILKSIESHRREMMNRVNSSHEIKPIQIVSRSINSLFDMRDELPDCDTSPVHREKERRMRCAVRAVPTSSNGSYAGCRPCRLSRFSTHNSPRGESSSVDLKRPSKMTQCTLLSIKDDVKIENLKRKMLDSLESDECDKLKLRVIDVLKKDISKR